MGVMARESWTGERAVSSLAKEYFAEAQVVFANQSRTPMQEIPLVVITPGNVNRPTHPNYEVVDGVLVGNYLSRFRLT